MYQESVKRPDFTVVKLSSNYCNDTNFQDITNVFTEGKPHTVLNLKDVCGVGAREYFDKYDGEKTLVIISEKVSPGDPEDWASLSQHMRYLSERNVLLQEVIYQFYQDRSDVEIVLVGMVCESMSFLNTKLYESNGDNNLYMVRTREATPNPLILNKTPLLSLIPTKIIAK